MIKLKQQSGLREICNECDATAQCRVDYASQDETTPRPILLCSACAAVLIKEMRPLTSSAVKYFLFDNAARPTSVSIIPGYC